MICFPAADERRERVPAAPYFSRFKYMLNSCPSGPGANFRTADARRSIA